MRRLFASVLATVLLGTVVGTAPAQAADGLCAPGKGVSVVVDFGGLQDVIAGGCDPDGGGVAGSKVMTDAGFTYTYTQRFPGLVCRVNDKPADAGCVNAPPTDAYWGLFWSDGTSGWKYSSAGIASLKVPEGGSIGWRWQDGGERDLPRVAPNPKPVPTPTAAPTTKPTQQPNQGPATEPGEQPTKQPSTSAAPSPTPTPSATPEGEPGGQKADQKADKKASKKNDRKERDRAEEAETEATAAPTPAVTAVEDLAPASRESADGGSGVLLVVGGVIVLLLAGSVVAVERRRRT